MSIATLKKKSRQYSRNGGRISHNTPFSLNSSRRLEGHHQEPQIQTPFRGIAPRGTGIPDDVQIINKSQRVNYDPYNTPRPSIKSNHAIINKLMWPKPIVKWVGSRNYDTYYGRLKSDCNIVGETSVCIQNIGVTKDLSLPSYEVYNSTQVLKNNCITSKEIHLPKAGNGLPCAMSC
jgi:hypothetical protein